MTPNDIAAFALEHKHSLRRQRRAWRFFARAVLIFGWAWAIGILIVLGWLAVRG